MVARPVRGSTLVLEIGPQDVVVETGAIEEPAFGVKNQIGWQIEGNASVRIWKEELDYIRTNLRRRTRGGLGVQQPSRTLGKIFRRNPR